MKNEGMLEGVSPENVNIDSAQRLIEDLELLSLDELPLHSEDINEKINALREIKKAGIDTPQVRSVIARLVQLQEKAQ